MISVWIYKIKLFHELWKKGFSKTVLYICLKDVINLGIKLILSTLKEELNSLLYLKDLKINLIADVIVATMLHYFVTKKSTDEAVAANDTDIIKEQKLEKLKTDANCVLR